MPAAGNPHFSIHPDAEEELVDAADIQRGRTYDLRTEPGRSLWTDVADRLQATTPSPAAAAHADLPGGWSDPVPTRRRMGQGTFQAVVLDAYGRQCAITSESAIPVVDAGSPSLRRPSLSGVGGCVAATLLQGPCR